MGTAETRAPRALLHLWLTAATQPRQLGLPGPATLPGKPDGFLMPAHRHHQARWTVSEDEAMPSGLLSWWLITQETSLYSEDTAGGGAQIQTRV